MMALNFKPYSKPALSGMAALVVAVCMLTGCAGAPSSDAAESIPTIAVLINHRWTEEDPRGFVWDLLAAEQSKEETFAACVRQAASSRSLPIQVITGTPFRAVVFPDLDPRTAPRSMEAMRMLIPDPRFQQRIKDARIDYVAVLGGETHTSETKGGIGCFGGYGAGACIGRLWWDHETHLSALVVDMRTGVAQLKEGDKTSSTSWFAILAVVPVAMPATNEAKGCENFGRAVIESLSDMLPKGE